MPNVKSGTGKTRVTTHTHVQDDSKWNNAISMGFFQNIEDAQAFLAALRSKGVRSAIIGARNLEQMKFVISEPPQSVVDKMVELKQEFPHELKPSSVKPRTIRFDKCR